MILKDFKVGTLLSINNMIVEVCSSSITQCSCCAGFQKPRICIKLPYCGNNLYYKRMSNYDIRKAKKEHRTIVKLE